MSRTIVFWRTSITLVVFAGFLLGGLIFCLHSGNGTGLFPAYATGIGALAVSVVAKSSLEHLANAGGLAGAGKALVNGAPPLTEAPPKGV